MMQPPIEPPGDEPTLARIIALRPPPAEALRADLLATRAEIDALLALERAPTPPEMAALRRKLSPPVDIASELPTLAERLRKLQKGVGARLPTGFETLDKATRGGIPRGKRVIFVGAPGAAKTFFALAISQKLLAADCHVAIHAADEDLDSILIRIGQSERLCREDLEEGNEHAFAKLAEIFEQRYERLLAVDQDEDSWTLDDTVDALVRRGQDGAAMLLFVDSIQTVRIRGSRGYRSRREEIDDVVRRIKSYSARGIIVVATSEMNRAGYRAKLDAENVEAIASAAESRSIEFAAHLMIALKGVKDHDDIIAGTIAKNRLGKKLKFRLQLNFDRATLAEVPPEEVPTPENEKAKEESRKTKRVRDLADEIFERLLKQRAPVTSLDQFRSLVKGNSDAIRLAVAVLKNEGRIEWQKTKGKSGRWRPVTSSSEASVGVSEEGSNGVSTHAHPVNTHVTTQGTQDPPVDVATQPTHALYEVKGGLGGDDAAKAHAAEADSVGAHPTSGVHTQESACVPNEHPSEEGEP